MRTDTYTPTCCDACGHKYAKGEKYGAMRFKPTGARFEVSYTVCLSCLPRIPHDAELTNTAVAKAIQRAPELLAYANSRGEA